MNALRQATLDCNGGQELMLVGVKANGAVKGRLLAMNLEQRFRNVSDTNAEITYTFPLPWGAILMGVDVELNGEHLQGEVTPRSTARARYEEAVSEGNSSIMLERNMDQSYTLELGNLMPLEECSIKVRYAQILALDHGHIRLMLPTTIAPRYGNSMTQSGLQPHQATVTDITAEYPFDITLTLHGELAKANIASPSHRTGYYPNGDELVIRLAHRGALDRDFILTIGELRNQSSAIVCADQCVTGQAALMANFSPDMGGASDLPVAVKILVDCSGSMAGDSIQAARSALREIIHGLQREDRFSLSRFGSTVQHRSRGMWGGTVQAKASAMRWVEGVEADLGGTEMESALLTTIDIAHLGKSDLLLVTDGEIHGIDGVIAVAKKSGHRVFVVAIGASPAEVHLRRLAVATGGVCEFVAPGEDVGPAVLRMFNRLRTRQASRLRLEWPVSANIRWAQALPEHVFQNDSLNLNAFVGTLPQEPTELMVRLWGTLDSTGVEQVLGEARIEQVESSANTLARVVAFARYQECAAEKEFELAPEARSLAQETALRYQLVTEETNFILVHVRDAARQAQEMPQLHQVPQMLPAGWGGSGSTQADTLDSGIVFSNKAQTSESAYVSPKAVVSSDKMQYSQQPVNPRNAAPSVYRTSRANSVQFCFSLDVSDKDDYEIPAFLRKQGDASARYRRCKSLTDLGITPSEFALWLATKSPSECPTTYEGLRDIGLGIALCEWLEFEMGGSQSEREVVEAFIAAVRSLEFDSALMPVLAAPMRTITNIENFSQLMLNIRHALHGISPDQWPPVVINFPAEMVA